MLGLAQGAFTKAVSYAYERKQFGKAVGDFQAMQVQFAEAATQIEGEQTHCLVSWPFRLVSALARNGLIDSGIFCPQPLASSLITPQD